MAITHLFLEDIILPTSIPFLLNLFSERKTFKTYFELDNITFYVYSNDIPHDEVLYSYYICVNML